MTIPLVKPGGWGYKEKLTSPQMNTVQTALTRCADIEATCYVSSVANWHFYNTPNFLAGLDVNAGMASIMADGLRLKYVVGTDANGNYSNSTGAFVRVPTLTADRVWTLSAPTIDDTQHGSFILISAHMIYPPTYHVRVNNVAGTQLALIGGAGNSQFGLFVYDDSYGGSGDWVSFAVVPY